MSDNTVTIRTRKLIRNPLLKRRQFVIEVVHSERANVSKEEIKVQLAKLHKVTDPTTISIFGFRTKFGGGKSTGFGLIYDSLESLKQFEPKHRQAKMGLLEIKKKSRKAIKEAKNKQLKIWGTGVRLARHKAKKNQED